MLSPIMRTSGSFRKSNPLLNENQIGTEADTGKSKVGDGVSPWNSLGYLGSSGLDLRPLDPEYTWLGGGTDLTYEPSVSSLDLSDGNVIVVPFTNTHAESEGLTTFLNGGNSTITAERDLLVQYTVDVNLDKAADHPIGFFLNTSSDSETLSSRGLIPAGFSQPAVNALQSVGFLRAGEAITHLRVFSSTGETAKVNFAGIVVAPIMG